MNLRWTHQEDAYVLITNCQYSFVLPVQFISVTTADRAIIMGHPVCTYLALSCELAPKSINMCIKIFAYTRQSFCSQQDMKGEGKQRRRERGYKGEGVEGRKGGMRRREGGG